MSTPNQAEWHLAKVIMGKSPGWRAVNGHERQELRRIARLLASHRPAPVFDRALLVDTLHDTLIETYDCQRVWSAWGVGTMSEEDFLPAGWRVEAIADEIIGALTA